MVRERVLLLERNLRAERSALIPCRAYMPTKSTLRTLVLVQVGAFVATYLAANLTSHSLFREYAIPMALFSTTPTLFWLGVLLRLAFLASSVGLCFFSSVSRTLYSILLAALLLAPPYNPTVRSASTDLFFSAEFILCGVVLALLYFSPLKSLYDPLDQNFHDSKRLLRATILVQVPVAILMAVAAFLSGLWSSEMFRRVSANLDRVRPGEMVLAGVSLVVFLAANIGLYVCWRGARTLYLVVTIFAMLETLYVAPSLTSAGVDRLATALNILTGVILGLLYFTPVRILFESAEAKVHAVSAVAAPAVQAPPPDSFAPQASAVSAQSPGPSPPSVPPRREEPMRLPPSIAQPIAQENVSAVAWESAPTPADPSPPPTSQAIRLGVAFCPACGAAAHDEKFCTQCGQPLPRKNLCPRCGREAEPEKKFCGECGTPLLNRS